jgi:hypothetical protein
MSALLYILALSGLWTVLVLGAVVGLFVLVGYAIYTLRSDEGWEERPDVRDDMDMDDIK